MGASLPTSASPYVSILAFGAVGDGVTNNATAIQDAFNYAETNDLAVYIPPGDFAYSGSLVANGIAIFGAGTASVLSALNVSAEALDLTGSGGSISNIQMDSPATVRLTPYTDGMIYVNGASNYTIENVLIDGSSVNGIVNSGSSNGLILDNTVENTQADSITSIDGANNITIEGNLIENSGDDSISTVSYAGSPIVQNITVIANTVLNQANGRGITVVGGNNETISGNYIAGGPSGSAGIYIASEAEYDTLGVANVSVTGNTLINTGGSDSTGSGQGAVTVYNSSGTTYNITGVTVTGNQIVDPLAQALQYVGTGKETITFSNNTDYSSNALTEGDDTKASITQSHNSIVSPGSYTTPLMTPAGGVELANIVLPAPSASGTTLQAGSTAYITDTVGNEWDIANNGQVAINGVVDAMTSNIIELAYVAGTIWAENSSDLWEGETSPNDSWGPNVGTLTSPVPTPSPTPTPTPTPTPAPTPTPIAITSHQSSVTITATGTTINATSGNHIIFITGSDDTFNLTGGNETVTEEGAGGNTYNLPAAGAATFVFNAAALADGDIFNLSAVLAGTKWTGSANTVSSFLHTKQVGANTELLVSKTASGSATGTLLATFDNETLSLSTILTHSVT